MKKRLLLSVMLASSFGIAGCGGGHDAPSNSAGDQTAQTNTDTTPTPTAATAPFAKAQAARYIWIGNGASVVGTLASLSQTASGAVTVINNISLTGEVAVNDVYGDTFFAMGRWAKGTVTSGDKTSVLDGVSNAAAHYVLVNDLAMLPTSGSYHCDSGKYTAPTYIAGSKVPSSAYAGASTGSATLAFDTTGATAAISLQTSAGGSAGAANSTATIKSPSATSVGSFISSQPAGIEITLGDGGDGKVLIVAAYKTTLNNGAQYQGVGVFNCSM
ncbi:hypothetical protein [Paraburkholderia rhizosphaerae]|uniref:Uncharacterized protein n=1 Tax=Paraburkholderia rhizosphaerae TaxID=480658 RepID=A0A4R8LHF8_9BURK|nr:hypothetical protein [Paraburkholderia rhizosphaerae]TDY42641.1 hypothetical protein BX592_1201 [Paraburkholderia rhizosphaerae]